MLDGNGNGMVVYLRGVACVVIINLISCQSVPYQTPLNEISPPSIWKQQAFISPATETSSENYGWIPLIINKNGNAVNNSRAAKAFTGENPIIVHVYNTTRSKNMQGTIRVIKPRMATVEAARVPKYNVEIINDGKNTGAVNNKLIEVTHDHNRIDNTEATIDAGKKSAVDILIQAMTDIQKKLQTILELTASKNEEAANEREAAMRLIEQKTREQEQAAAKRASSGVPQGSILAPLRVSLAGGYGVPNLDSKRAAATDAHRHRDRHDTNETPHRKKGRSHLSGQATDYGNEHEQDDDDTGKEPSAVSNLIEGIKKLSTDLNDINPTNNYELSRKVTLNRVTTDVESRTPESEDFEKPPFGFPHGYNSLNHLPPEPLMALFLSHYGKYLPGVVGGREARFRNLYSYTASNNVHNNQPQGSYKVFEDQDEK